MLFVFGGEISDKYLYVYHVILYKINVIQKIYIEKSDLSLFYFFSYKSKLEEQDHLKGSQQTRFCGQSSFYDSPLFY